ncbi:MAG TPA: DUF433 domain-containing protein [Pyrinomonadaceae bacterium]|nr:DUF433 domain-containing protein [Pyrinomonadaceae bacterium]
MSYLGYTLKAMSQAITTVPLSMDEAGVLRIDGTRVSLDSIVYAFDEGATPEEIVQSFPTLDLKDVYAVISYYLQNRDEVEKYLSERQVERQELKRELETRFNPNGLRERLLARKR